MKKQKIIEIECCDICERENVYGQRSDYKYNLCESCHKMLGKKINGMLEENNYTLLTDLVNQIRKEIPLFKLKQ